MKSIFAPHLMTQDERDAVFDQSIIVLDTNVLLRMYSFSRPASDEMLKLLATVTDRLWLPYQVGWEFFRNKSSRRDSLTAPHQELINDLESLKKKIENHGGQRSHVAGNAEGRQQFISAIQRYVEYLKREMRELGTWAKLDPDSILERILDLFDGRSAGPPSAKWYAKRTREGERRYASLVPPGYADVATKGTDNVYGDYFLWKECIAHAKAEGRPLVLVTEDAKEDWRSKKNKSTPRPELLQEFYARSGQLIQIFSIEDLRRELARRLNNASEREAAESIREEIVEAEATSRSSQSVMADITRDIFRQIAINAGIEDWMESQRQMLAINLPKIQPPDYYARFGRPIKIDQRLLNDLMGVSSDESERGKDPAPNNEEDEDDDGSGNEERH